MHAAAGLGIGPASQEIESRFAPLSRSTVGVLQSATRFGGTDSSFKPDLPGARQGGARQHLCTHTHALQYVFKRSHTPPHAAARYNRHSQYTSKITPNSEAVKMKDSDSVLRQQKV